MNDERNLRLCGGTFFVLLLRAKYKRTEDIPVSVSERKKIKLTESACLIGLIRVFDPDYVTPSERIKTDTGDYKKCGKSDGVNLPLTDVGLLEQFDRDVRTHYRVPLKRMRDFCNMYVDNREAEWLIHALLELMARDRSILQSTRMYCNFDGTAINFGYLEVARRVYLPAFLLGIWHFILTQRPDNSVGKETYQAWFRLEKGSTDTWISDIGQSGRFAGVKYERPPQEELLRRGVNGRPPIREDDGEEDRLYGDYRVYLEKVKASSCYVKTLLNSYAPWNFYSVYVPNQVHLRTGCFQDGEMRFENEGGSPTLLDDVTPAKLAAGTNYIILTGPGGIGKSMMMTHLLLTAAEVCEENRQVPVLLKLKDYKGEFTSLFKVIWSAVSTLQPGLAQEDFVQDLDSGHFLLLFDGLDEIRSTWRGKFEQQLSEFVSSHGNNVFVISTRPQPEYVHMRFFTTADVLPFEKEQALQLIDKLDPLLCAPEMTAGFRAALDERLYDSHTSFARNPLLLTLMLSTWQQYGNIPEKQYLFYRDAYETLARRQDATKVGFSRVWETGWTPERFAKVFGNFCARTYINEQYDFSMEEMERTYAELDTAGIPSTKGEAVTAQDFVQDAVNSVCLMFYENQSYHFMHRSFQEYFCALFFSRQDDCTLPGVGHYFEKRNGGTDDGAFAMLYDMIPSKVERYILLPFLSELFAAEDREAAYERYLCRAYPQIRAVYGGPGDIYCRPDSFLVWFVCTLLNVADAHRNLSLKGCEEFRTENFYMILTSGVDGHNHEMFYTQTELDDHGEMYGYEDYAGCVYTVPTQQVLADREKYPDLVADLTDERFELKKEFAVVYDYWLQLKEECEEKARTAPDPFGFLKAG